MIRHMWKGVLMKIKICCNHIWRVCHWQFQRLICDHLVANDLTLESLIISKEPRDWKNLAAVKGLIMKTENKQK